MRALVVGQGSIGRRHAEVLRRMGCDVAVVTRRSRELRDAATYGSIEVAVHEFRPEYVVLARETSAHAVDLAELADLDFRGRVLVEKPATSAPVALPVEGFAKVAVGYNLRFHPTLIELRRLVRDRTIVCAQAYAGQHLSTWRPERDFRDGYSARAGDGGGVLRDLSHELDYLQWLLGPWHAVCASGGSSGTLGIDSDDHWALLLTLDRCPVVSVQLNYFDRIAQRFLTIATTSETFHADFRAGTLQVNGRVEHVSVDRDLTYQRQHAAMLNGHDMELLCSWDEGVRVVELVAAAERSAASRAWVSA